MTIKPSVIPAAVAAAGLDPVHLSRWIDRRCLVPLTSPVVGRNRVRKWSLEDATRVALLARFVAAGLPPRAGACIGRIPVGQGRLLAIVHQQGDVFRSKIVDAPDIADLIADNPSAMSVTAACIDDAAATVAILDQAARDEVDA